MDFVKSGCEKSWAEVQTDSFSFEWRGCTSMKELQGGVRTAEAARCCSGGKGAGGLHQWFWWEAVDDKVGKDDERDARESSPQPGRRLRGVKVTSHRETGHKETGRRETGRKEMRRKEMGGKTNGSKERGVGETVAKESGGKETIVKAMGVRETGGCQEGRRRECKLARRRDGKVTG